MVLLLPQVHLQKEVGAKRADCQSVRAMWKAGVMDE